MEKKVCIGDKITVKKVKSVGLSRNFHSENKQKASDSSRALLDRVAATREQEIMPKNGSRSSSRNAGVVDDRSRDAEAEDVVDEVDQEDQGEVQNEEEGDRNGRVEVDVTGTPLKKERQVNWGDTELNTVIDMVEKDWKTLNSRLTGSGAVTKEDKVKIWAKIAAAVSR